MRQPKLLISVFILLMIGLHFVPVLRRGQGARNIFWPFLTWTMYKDSRPPGPIEARKRRLIGITSKGQAEEVTAKVVGLGPPALARRYLQPMLAGDSSAAQQLISRLNLRREDPFIELRMEGERYTVTDAGIVKEDIPVITYRVHPSESR
jgi:hypothetical protein